MLLGNERRGLHLPVRRTVGTGVNDVTIVTKDARKLPGYLVPTVDTLWGCCTRFGFQRGPICCRHQPSVVSTHYLL